MRRKGFTLIELMIVVVIIGILAALAIPRFMAASKKSKISEARLVLKQIWTAAQTYYEENGQYPPTVDDLFDNMSAWNGVPVERPSGRARFQYDITTGGTAGFQAVAVAIGKDGTNAASSREQLDASLSDVVDLTIDINGNITGGTF